MKQKFINYYMDIADLTSKLSSARRLQVGAVIVKGNKIVIIPNDEEKRSHDIFLSKFM